MVDYGKTRSTVKPEELEITESLVFFASNIQPIKEDGVDRKPGFEGYEYDLISYTKDEYIRDQRHQITQVKQQLGDTRDYLYGIDLMTAEAYVNSEYAAALAEIEV